MDPDRAQLKRHARRGRALLGPVLFPIVLAVSDAAGQEPIQRLPEVRVTAPAPLADVLSPSSTPSRIDGLGETDLRRVRPSVLPEALERLPGVSLSNEQGSRLQPSLTLRGFTASPVTGIPQGLSVFLDGVRLNEPTAEEVNFDLIPLEDVERVEVIRGPSVLFGRNTLGGAVNLVTRRGQSARELVPEIVVGSFGRRDYRLRLGGEARPLDYALSVTESLDDGFRDVTAARVSRVFAKLGLQAGGTDAAVSYQWSDDHIEQAGSLPEVLARRDRAANFTPDFFAPRLHQAIVNVEHAVTESLTVGVNAFGRVLDAEQFNVNRLGPNSRLLTETRSAGGTLELRHSATVAGRRNVLVTGLDYAHHRVGARTLAESDGVALLAASLADTQDAVGVFAQDSLTLARDFLVAGSTLVLTAAGRWDWLRHDITDRLGGPSEGQHRFSRLDPRAGVNVNLGAVGAYASYAEGVRAPAFLELTCAGPGAICPGLQVGVAPDPPLHPVTARSYEVGVTTRPRGWLDVDVSAFRIDVRDDIFSVAPAGTIGVFFQNVARTRRQGLETSIRARAGQRLDGYVTYAYTRATFQSTTELATPVPPGIETVRAGDSLALVPRHRITAGLAYRPWSWATFSLDANHVGEQFLRGDEVNQRRPLSAYTVVNVGAAFRTGGLETFVRVTNALNAEYETFGTFAVNAAAAGAPVQRFVTPAPPIGALVGVQYAF
jgi:outer membrane receptor protein involved in Fe transport